MSSLPHNISYEMVSEPLDEDEVRFYQAFGQQGVGEFVRIKICVRHELCVTLPQQPSLLLLVDSYLYQQTMLVPIQSFLQNGLTLMQIYVPSLVIPSQSLYNMMPNLMAYVEVARNSPMAYRYESHRICVYPMVLNVYIQMLIGEYDNDHITNTNVMEFMGEDEDDEDVLVPASDASIESLEKVKIEDGETNDMCVICQIVFDPEMEVTKMPCRHVYHKECIVQWLRTSHMCPVCRYPMPTSTSG
jgi:hypothetical protein